MKKRLLPLLSLLAVMFFFSSCSYNSMVKKDETVKSKWGEVQTQYQRRADLITNLVNTVKGAAANERGTLEAVINARAKATQITVNADDLSPEKIKEYQAAQGELSQALGKLMMLTEAYPDLKTNQNFLALQDEIAGTENRIGVARKNFNESVQEYNSSIRSFPANITAKMFGFKEKGYFEADATAQKAPEVKF
ncbi:MULTISPECIES: LemA family protein [Edaphocola]|jgi:LemA protein|uniref:LemA family protein n=1 Tax=Edaphocola TaxID=2601681 RepID=UPI00100B94C3|nr:MULTISPECIES: LemA family protein [Edaphocola]